MFMHGVILIGLVWFSSVALALPASYTIQPLPIKPDLSNSKLLLNEQGQIAGSEMLYGDNQSWIGSRGFFWNQGVITYFGGNQERMFVSGLNNNGQLTGRSLKYDEKGDYLGQLGFIWANGNVITLGNLGINDHFNAAAVNDNGQLLLNHYNWNYYEYDDGRPDDAYIWTNGNLLRLDGMLDAFAMNSAGQVAGSIRINPEPFAGERPAIWDNRNIAVLQTPSVFSGINTVINTGRSFAQLINDHGQAAGYLGGSLNGDPNRPVSHAFYWSNGVLTHLIDDNTRQNLQVSDVGKYLNLKEIYSIQLKALNNRGLLGGQIDDRIAFIFNGQLGVKLIPLLGYCNEPSSNSITIGGLNDAGIIVGASSKGLQRFNVVGSLSCDYVGNQHAFIYDSANHNQGVTLDLNRLLSGNDGWDFTNAYAINNLGQILVSGNKGYALLNPSTNPPDPVPQASCDANQDGRVNRSDLAIIKAYDRQFNPAYDLDGDEIVSVRDIRICVTQCSKTRCAL